MIETIAPKDISKRLKAYYITTIFSILFALIGFSYNLWRLEATEENNTTRTASFEVLNDLADLENIIYALHYDKDIMNGNPRNGWVKVGLIVDLSSLLSNEVLMESEKLRELWGESWSMVEENRDATDKLVEQIDEVRKEIRMTIKDLK